VASPLQHRRLAPDMERCARRPGTGWSTRVARLPLPVAEPRVPRSAVPHPACSVNLIDRLNPLRQPDDYGDNAPQVFYLFPILPSSAGCGRYPLRQKALRVTSLPPPRTSHSHPSWHLATLFAVLPRATMPFINAERMTRSRVTVAPGDGRHRGMRLAIVKFHQVM
jgi:hypothetical protein